LVAWQCVSSRVMRLSNQGYLAHIENLFLILAAWKCDSSWFLRPSDDGYLASYELRFWHFGGM
jgi:poly(A) polymerase Pap1